MDVYDLDGNRLKTINLIADYDPINPTGPDTLKDRDGDGLITAGVLPIQTPVDPTGRVVVTANTGGTITLVDTSIDQIVAMLPSTQDVIVLTLALKRVAATMPMYPANSPID